jgi:hypothetical protein
VPGGNLAALKKTTSNGKGSEQTKKVGVVLKAHTRRVPSRIEHGYDLGPTHHGK